MPATEPPATHSFEVVTLHSVGRLLASLTPGPPSSLQGNLLPYKAATKWEIHGIALAHAGAEECRQVGIGIREVPGE